MDTQNPKATNFSESFPFFSKYGHYVLATITVALLVNLVLRSWRKGEQFSRPPTAAHAKSESAIQDMSPDEEFDQSNDSEADPEAESYLPRDLVHVKFEYSRPSEAEMLARSLEFYEMANARRSLRFFSSDPVPRDVIRNIIKAAGTSPSGAHTEPWTFAVVSDYKLKQDIRGVVEGQERINYAQRMGRQWTADLRPLRTNWSKGYLTEAPYLILVFKQEYGRLPSGARKFHYYKEMSVAIACGILIAAIQYAGLVTLTSTPMNCGSALRALLNRPSNEKLVLLLPVGYPAEDATVPDLKRKELKDILIEYD